MFGNFNRRNYYGRNGFLNELGTYVVGMLFLLVIFMAAYLIPGPVRGEPLEGADMQDIAGTDDMHIVAQLVRAQQWWLSAVNARDARHGRVNDVACFVAGESRYYALDPHILMQTLIDESSLKLKQVGRSNGELGLGQQHGQALLDSTKAMKLRGIDPDSIHGQIGRTAWCLKDCERKCKSELAMVSRYRTGRCKPSIKAQRESQGRLRRASKLAQVSK